MTTTVLWLRRDLRLSDHPALLAAAGSDGDRDRVVLLFVIDPALWNPAGPARQAWLVRSLRALAAATGGALVIRHGDPVEVVPAVAREAGATSVHVTADAGPYGRRRDAAVAETLRADGVRLVATGTPYAIGPGTLLTGGGTPFQVFTPFRTAWLNHGWPGPAPRVTEVTWHRLDGEQLPPEPDLAGTVLPEAGEQAAHRVWESFLQNGLRDYADRRDLPGVPGTSTLSAHLKYGEIHPRTLLADLAGRPGAGAEVFRSELCWREFYADVLWHHPDSARDYLRPAYARMQYDDPTTGEPAERLEAWREGRTGFPFVDAGMRQLLAEGWMHNRVRMVVASFLVKHLHLEWQYGARHFMRHLRDGDLASNSHGWQWTAGSGTDAAPYFRIFNPVTQGLRFDPDGAYVRRYVPELAHLDGARAHEPWRHPEGLAHGYPDRLIDLADERAEALARLAALKDPR
ncbi:MAG: deoxyribodipyrimidine photo-lyase [Kineosporiaceae bacterium]